MPADPLELAPGLQQADDEKSERRGDSQEADDQGGIDGPIHGKDRIGGATIRPATRGGAVRELAGLITRRSRVQIPPPLFERPWKQGLSVFGAESVAANFCQTFARPRRSTA